MNFSTLTEITASFPTIMPSNQQPIQLRANQQIDSTRNTLGGFLLIFVFISYICLGLRYRKHKKEYKSVQFQQIKNLEKIWKMPAYKRKN